jgi:hypothetical protein
LFAPFYSSQVFLLRYIRDAVWMSPMATTLSELAGRIRAIVATITLDLLTNVRPETEYRHDICHHSRYLHWTL